MKFQLNCLLCLSDDTVKLFHDDTLFTYYACKNCGLHFAQPDQRLSPEVEKSRYENHENNPDDPEYRKFLNQLFLPLNKLLPEGSLGLDFGSGPGPTLNKMFEEAGHTMHIYDPFYANNPEVLNLKYDFITSTETVEHFYNPRREFELIWNLLKPGGCLGIMTKILLEPENFESWYYRNEDTHVVFYQKQTLQWLAKYFNANITFHGDRVCIFQKINI